MHRSAKKKKQQAEFLEVMAGLGADDAGGKDRAASTWLQGNVSTLSDPVVPRFELASLWMETMGSGDAKARILSMDCQGRTMVVLFEDGALTAHDTNGMEKIFSATVQNAHKAFVDPTGSFIIATALDGEVHFFDIRDERLAAKVLLPVSAAAAGTATAVCVGESVCWCSALGSTAVKEKKARQHYCILGTQQGGVLVELTVELTPSNTFRASRGRTVQLPNFVPSCLPVVSVVMGTIGNTCFLWASCSVQLFRCCVQSSATVAATPADVFSALCTGSAWFDVEKVPDRGTNDTRRGALSLFRVSANSAVHSFAWTSAAGVVHGAFHRPVEEGQSVDQGQETRSGNTVYEEMIPFGNTDGMPQGRHAAAHVADDSCSTKEVPLLALPTAFHMVLLYSHRCLVLNHPPGLPWRGNASAIAADYPIQSAEVTARVCFDPFCSTKQLLGLQGAVRDVAERKVYLYGERCVWELQMEQEHRQQWRLFLERALRRDLGLLLRTRLFAAAYKLCAFHPAQRRVVLFLQGNFYLRDMGAIEEATTAWAMCDAVAEVYMRLLLQRDNKALYLYLTKRYDFLVQCSQQEKGTPSQELMAQLACFIVLVLLQNFDHAAPDEFLSRAARRCPMLFEHDGFFNTLLWLMGEWGREKKILSLVEQLGRFRCAIAYYVLHANYAKAVNVLTRASLAGKHEMAEAWYEFSPVLIQQVPIALVTGMLKITAGDVQAGRPPMLQMERLLLALTRYTSPEMNEDRGNTEHQVVILLEQCVHHFQCTSTAVHHHYLTLLAELQDTERLEEFLEGSVFYEVDFALRTCLRHHCFAACLFLYQRLHLYEDAIRIALDFSVPERPDSDWPALRQVTGMLHSIKDEAEADTLKRLWLLTAHLVVAKCSPVAMLALVEDSDGVLQLEDVLMGISDERVVQDLKNAICHNLDQYSLAISTFHQKQQEAYCTAEEVKRELAELRHQCGYVTLKQRCPLCRQRLLQSAEPYLIYPNCQHVCHVKCAAERLAEIGGLEAFVTDEGIAPHVLEGVKTLDELAHRDCVICGEAAIVEIDIPICEEDPLWAI